MGGAEDGMSEVRGKRVLVVGLARTGFAAARCLAHRGAVVTVSDARPPSAFQHVIPELTALKVGLELGSQRDETFLRHDLIVVSPGVPRDLAPLRAAREQGIEVLPEVEVASWFLSNPIVGITGTNGKTTTTTLVGKMLEASGFPTFVGGNIGVPLILAVDHVSPETVLVAELSSFQLEAIRTFHPHVAVLLNLTPNHLDRHASFEDYVEAKAKIFSNLGAADYAILNADDANVAKLAPALPSLVRKIFFSRRQNLPAGVLLANGHIRYRVGHLERALFEVRDIALRGAFNLENVLAATLAACVLGADFEAVRRAVREFHGVEHRLELVGELRGVEFYNDSKATSVDATAKALSAFARGVHLILGGTDKGAPYSPLRPLLKDRAQAVYLIGAAAERIAADLDGAVELVRSGELETAVRTAFRKAQAGDSILLSPACASFDQFQDYEHRGRVFKEIVESLASEGEIEGAMPPPRPRDARPTSERREEHQSPAAAPPASTSVATAPPEAFRCKVEGTARPLERVYVYEVEAEEVTAGEQQVECADNELTDVEARSPEPASDEPLPFEVPGSTRRKEALLSRSGPRSDRAGGRKASAGGGKPESD